MTVATLKGLERDLGAVQPELLDIDCLGFQQIGLHSNILSIPPIRYTGKADEAPDPPDVAALEQIFGIWIRINANTVRRSATR
jgi:hypothetical protein